jgi:protoporphyrinogen IX oxidase
MSWLAQLYLWIKALHIVSMVAWMAGLFYLPRLFVYHSEARPGSEISQTFAVMERRLLRAIMNPAMVATWLFGILLALTPGVVDWSRGWIYIKLAGVAGLTLFHHFLAAWRRDFLAGGNRHGPRFYRFVNEVPTLLLILIVFLVVVKPV